MAPEEVIQYTVREDTSSHELDPEKTGKSETIGFNGTLTLQGLLLSLTVQRRQDAQFAVRSGRV